MISEAQDRAAMRRLRWKPSRNHATRPTNPDGRLVADIWECLLPSITALLTPTCGPLTHRVVETDHKGKNRLFVYAGHQFSVSEEPAPSRKEIQHRTTEEPHGVASPPTHALSGPPTTLPVATGPCPPTVLGKAMQPDPNPARSKPKHPGAGPGRY